MDAQNSIKLFETKHVRTAWNENEEEWYFSVVDVVGILTDQPTQDGARNYWKVLKNRLIAEGNEPATNCNRLKLPAQDGKMRMTDVASTEQIFRIIQSIPSPKAEPFKQCADLYAALLTLLHLQFSPPPQLPFSAFCPLSILPIARR